MARLLNSALSCRSFVGIEARWWFLIRFAIVPGFFIKPRSATKILRKKRSENSSISPTRATRGRERGWKWSFQNRQRERRNTIRRPENSRKVCDAIIGSLKSD